MRPRKKHDDAAAVAEGGGCRAARDGEGAGRCRSEGILHAGGDEARRRDFFVAAARDCCSDWWISAPHQQGAGGGAADSTAGDGGGYAEWEGSAHARPRCHATSAAAVDRGSLGAPAAGSHRAVTLQPRHAGAAARRQDVGGAAGDSGARPVSGAVPLSGSSGDRGDRGDCRAGTQHGMPGARMQRPCSSAGQGGWRRAGRRCFADLLGWGRSGVLLVVLLHCILWQPAGSWIALSKDGYTIKHNLIAEAGVSITGDLRVNGVLMSKPVSNILCTPEREGSIRWNDEFFESCDGVHDWQPVQFCDRSCAVNAHAVPCGVPVLNKCGVDCNQVGTGLNMRQCLLKTSTSACNTEVVDNCGNPCGIEGQFDCDSKEAAYGGVVIKSLEHAPSTAGFEFTVGARDGSSKDSLFMTYKNLGGIAQVLTRINRVNDHATGMEFAKPPGQPQATMRVSMFTELTGELIQLGRSPGHSQLFVDGVLDKECPLVFNGGVHDGNFTKMCLETPTQQRTITLPDASGTVITSGNREDISNVPGLEGDNTLVYTGSYRDLRGIKMPRIARVSCHDLDCDQSNISMPDRTTAFGCSSIDYASNLFDVFRVYYMLDEGRDVTYPEPLKERLSFATPTIAASHDVRQALREFWSAYENHTAYERPRMELVLRFLRFMAEEQGLDVSGAFHDSFDALLRMQQFGEVSGVERCFVCCGHLTPDSMELGLVPSPRTRPQFCVGGDKDGSICKPDCPAGEACSCTGGGACVDDAAMSCFEHDFGVKCYDLTQRPNFTSTVNFTQPSAQRQLLVCTYCWCAYIWCAYINIYWCAYGVHMVCIYQYILVYILIFTEPTAQEQLLERPNPRRSGNC